MLYWPTMKESPDNEVIGFMKEVAEYIERMMELSPSGVSSGMDGCMNA